MKKSLKIVPIDLEKKEFQYSLEPGAEIIGITNNDTAKPSLLVICDPDEPAIEKHKFICFSFRYPNDGPFYELPDQDVIYIGALGDCYVFEVLE